MKHSVLTEAAALIDGDRHDAYGDPRENHQRIADLWTVILGHPISPEQAALCMVGVKVARLAPGLAAGEPPHHDSLVDGAAYFAVLQRIADGAA